MASDDACTKSPRAAQKVEPQRGFLCKAPSHIQFAYRTLAEYHGLREDQVRDAMREAVSDQRLAQKAMGA